MNKTKRTLSFPSLLRSLAFLTIVTLTIVTLIQVTLIQWTVFVMAAGGGDDLDRVVFRGRVEDQAGRLVVRARVLARRLGVGDQFLALSDLKGEYRLGQLPPGRYQISAEAAGFEVALSPFFDTLAGETIRYDFRLDPGRIVETMDVTVGGESLRLDPGRMVTGTTIGQDSITGLPLERRNVLDLVHLLPGSALPGLSDQDLAEGDRQSDYRRPPEENGIFSLAGGSPFSNNVTIEGLDNNDDRTGRERFIPVLAGVEEVQVISNQFSAEYGRASGGRVNLRLREGSARIHGELFHFYRDARLNANGYLRNADPRRSRRLPFFNSNPGGAIGGPLGRRVRFFSAYEFDYIDDRTEIAVLVPVRRHPGLALPRPNGGMISDELGLYDESVRTPFTSHRWQSRLDVGLARHRLGGLLTFGQSRDERGFPGGWRLRETMRGTSRESISGSIVDEMTVSAGVFNSLRWQWSRLQPRDTALRALAPVVLIGIEDPRPAGTPGGERSGTLVAGSSNSGGLDRRETRWQLQETLTIARGRHTLRSGVDLQVIDSRFTDLADTSGTWYFDSPATLFANQPSRFVQRFQTGSRVSNRYTGLFWQHDWQVRPGISIAGGLRWETESVLADRRNLGPRISMAWAPASPPAGGGVKRGREFVVRIGYGGFFNRAMLRTIDDFQLTTQRRRLDTNLPAAEWLLHSLRFPQRLTLESPGIAAATISEIGFQRRLSPGLRVPESRQFSLGFDHLPRRDLKLEVDYVHHRGARLWRESNGNAPNLDRAGGQWASWADYLLSLELINLPDPLTGKRPWPGAADRIRFTDSTTPTQLIRDGRGTVVVYGLNSLSTSNATNGLRTALAALRQFRAQPALTQIEELQSNGHSRYDGLNLGLAWKFRGSGRLRIGYTLSRTVDDGVVNTSSPLVVGDLWRERSLSLLDSRHRLVISGTWGVPVWLGGWTVGGIAQATSSRPFNIGINGNDRNLDDVGNDRPNYYGPVDEIVWRHPDEKPAAGLIERYSLPMIGTSGNLPRNAGRGPAIHTLSLRLSRTLRLSERYAAQFHLESFNPLNSTIFSFGAEYIDFNPVRTERFLVPSRTIRPRTMRLGLRLTF